jgi:hypothetical protein
MKKRLLTMLFLGAVWALPAEVYWLGPAREKGGQSDRLSAVLPGMEKVLYTTKVNVNSFSGTMKVSAVTGNIEEILLQLKKLPIDKLHVSGGTVRFQRKLKNGMIERFLLIASRPGRPISCFRMFVPEKAPSPGQWPSVLPALPPGAEITAVTQLGEGGICGEFRNASEPAYVVFRRVDSEMRSRKLYAAGNEIANRDGGRGAIYFNENTLVWVTVDNNGNGTFFYRPRKK